jgi:hypothetical protein
MYPLDRGRSILMVGLVRSLSNCQVMSCHFAVKPESHRAPLGYGGWQGSRGYTPLPLGSGPHFVKGHAAAAAFDEELSLV